MCTNPAAQYRSNLADETYFKYSSLDTVRANILPSRRLLAFALLLPTEGHFTEWMSLNVDVALPRVSACLHSSIHILFG